MPYRLWQSFQPRHRYLLNVAKIRNIYLTCAAKADFNQTLTLCKLVDTKIHTCKQASGEILQNQTNARKPFAGFNTYKTGAFMHPNLSRFAKSYTKIAVSHDFRTKFARFRTPLLLCISELQNTCARFPHDFRTARTLAFLNTENQNRL